MVEFDVAGDLRDGTKVDDELLFFLLLLFPDVDVIVLTPFPPPEATHDMDREGGRIA